ncbi:uncharacterized protein Z520_02410 [Fonsecaea multimorphosa CBS 102226]|uniref:Enoyl reductase (ER) domain-containing protein n=1 Tax=Fonsecaea multimorphosa CBS 102226 TaxID=1442371 RepID=A0A0D2IZ04_9EURO|nr:uncharacterized protein Z520_02410 [Fonsecaea multimorphosa CBS 102226]KIY02272.1 hypothetical protein Z520_02410 [Fonsecaea multimorphosa CBS 102226]
MTAVQITEFHKPYEIRHIETPRILRPYDLFIKTVAASLCHTDVMVIEGNFPTELPCTASHEGTGIVLETGCSVEGFKKGDRVLSGLPRNPCTECEDCRGPDDYRQYCTHVEGQIGTIVDGAFAEYHIADSRTSCLIPDGISFAEAAPLACAGRTVYRSIIASGIQTGEWLAIVGAGGGLGHLGVQFALAKGINVIAIDARDEGLKLCTKVGAKHIIDARNGLDSVVAELRDLTGGRGADATINVSAHRTSARLACAVTKMHGVVVQTAGPEDLSISAFDLIFRDIRIKGSLLAGREGTLEMLSQYEKRRLKVEINLFYGLDQVPVMLEALHSGKMMGKAVCIVDREAFEVDGSMQGSEIVRLA